MMKESLLKRYSLGLVAKDILEDEVYIDVYPIELTPTADGEVTTLIDQQHTVTDAIGGISNILVTKANVLKAKWMPNGDTNRLEPPTVCKNELVSIYQYSDTDEYYWTTIYNQLELRKLEKRTIILSNKASIDIPADQLLEHSYYVTMDTINKIVHLHTSTTDGEYTTYDIALDTAEGQLEIIDGKGNRVFLDSKADAYEVDIINSITTKTATKTNNADTKKDNITGRYDIKLKSYSVDNGADELIQTLMDFAQEVTDAIGIGNLGFPVPMDSATQSKLQAIKTRLQGFK